MMFNSIAKIFILCMVVNFAIAEVPRQAGGSEFIGKSCDHTIYKKVIKPFADAHERIELEYKTSKERNDPIEKIFLDYKSAVEKEMKIPAAASDAVQREAFEGFVRAKGCNGFAELYLTCHSVTNLCVCKTKFPFNNTEQNGTTCIPQLGSICAVGDDDPLTCAGGVACKGAEGGLMTRYCGGNDEFEKFREARLKELKENNAFKSNPYMTWAYILVVFLMTVNHN